MNLSWQVLHHAAREIDDDAAVTTDHPPMLPRVSVQIDVDLADRQITIDEKSESNIGNAQPLQEKRISDLVEFNAIERDRIVLFLLKQFDTKIRRAHEQQTAILSLFRLLVLTASETIRRQNLTNLIAFLRDLEANGKIFKVHRKNFLQKISKSVRFDDEKVDEEKKSEDAQMSEPMQFHEMTSLEILEWSLSCVFLFVTHSLSLSHSAGPARIVRCSSTNRSASLNRWHHQL